MSEHEQLKSLGTIKAGDHKAYMMAALALAQKSPPKATNFCVGAILLNESRNDTLATGFTLEFPGNTHAEECCLTKLEDSLGRFDDAKLSAHDHLILYTTMEPCNKRVSGKTPCVDRILGARFRNIDQRISKVYVGICEPEKFVGANEGKQRFEEAGIEYIHVPGLEDRISNVATSGHTPDVHNASD